MDTSLSSGPVLPAYAPWAWPMGVLRQPCLSIVFLLLWMTPALRADTVTLTPSVTHSGSTYTYNYTISESYDPNSYDVFLIDISVPAVPGSIFDLTAPAGFDASYDSGLGLVSFLEDASSFSSTPLSGFSFDSLGAPTASSFQATILNEADPNILTLDGHVTAPGAAMSSPPPAPTPEPSSLLLTASCLPFLFFLLKRAMKESSLQTERISS